MMESACPSLDKFLVQDVLVQSLKTFGNLDTSQVATASANALTPGPWVRLMEPVCQLIEH